MRLVLYQPDIPQNAGTLLRLGACLGVRVEIIEPAGFDLSQRAFRRAGMDYLWQANWCRHASWDAFCDVFDARRAADGARLILASTRGGVPHVQHSFATGDHVMLGRESAGVPEPVRAFCDHVVTIPMADGARSLNVAVSGAMVLGEALRQTRWSNG